MCLQDGLDLRWLKKEKRRQRKRGGFPIGPVILPVILLHE